MSAPPKKIAACYSPPPPAPSTRFQGSKLKLLPWLWEHLGQLEFHTCLDAFGGSASVSHLLKQHGKAVTFNDALACCQWSGAAMIENQGVRLDEAAIETIAIRHDGRVYDDCVARNFAGIYFTAEENVWLDAAAQNIGAMPGRFGRAIAWRALFQAALAKRPYNLFHRKNLYMREAAVSRSFGNKATWDRPFATHFRRFAEQTNAAVFQGEPCRAVVGDAMAVEGEFDLVYVDPPYLNARGVGVDYHGFYHFLEGLCDYGNWAERIDFASMHRRLRSTPNPWQSRSGVRSAFKRLFERFGRSTLAVSYRSDGIPSIDDLASLLRRVKRRVVVHTLNRNYQYALSVNRTSSEVLLIGSD